MRVLSSLIQYITLRRARKKQKRSALHMLALSGVVRPSHVELRYATPIASMTAFRAQPTALEHPQIQPIPWRSWQHNITLHMKQTWQWVRIDSHSNPHCYPGFDYLRALLALGVIAWHVHLFGTSELFRPGQGTHASIEPSDVLNFQVLALAVPTFFLMSMVLFIERVRQRGAPYFQQRLQFVLTLYLGWVALWTVLTWAQPAHHFGNLNSTLHFIVRGGFSVFWFFFSLLVLIIVAYGVRKSSKPLLWALLVGSIGILVLSNLLARTDGKWAWLVAHANPLNFVPYVFIAALLGHNAHKVARNKPFFFALIVGFILTSMGELTWLPHDNYFPHNDVLIPVYSRLSLVIGSVLLVLFACRIQRPPPQAIRWLARYSLALYCLHPFLIYAMVRLPMAPPVQSFEGFLILVAVCCALAVFLQRLPLVGPVLFSTWIRRLPNRPPRKPVSRHRKAA